MYYDLRKIPSSFIFYNYKYELNTLMKNGKNLPDNLIVNYHKGITSISPPQRVAMRIKYIY